MTRARVARLAATLAASSVFLIGGLPGHSEANQVHAFVVGRSPGLANCEWLDASNTSRAAEHFPSQPEVAFRIRIPGGIGQAPASDAGGNLFITHGEPRVSKLDALGRTLWTRRLASEASSAPVLTSAGALLVVTRDADALLVSPSGQVLGKSSLPIGEPMHRTLTIPTDNGGALVASGTVLVELDAAGTVTRQAHTLANITAIAQTRSDLLAIGDNGSVSLAHLSGDFEVIGNLGGAAPEGGAIQNGKLFAIVDEHKLVQFDLTERRAVMLASESAVGLNGPPVLFENQSSVVVADGGFLSLHAASGAETVRVPIAEASRAFDPATRGLRPALMIGDAGGAVAATRGGSDALFLASDGKALRLENTSCLDPFRPTPTRGGVVFACRSGQLFGIRDRAP